MASRYLLKKMRLIHCARGPKRCKKCADYAKKEKIALLDMDPPQKELITRPMTEIKIQGEKILVAFDVVKYFESIEEAEKYLEENDLIAEKEKEN